MDNTSSDILLAVFAFVSFACFCPCLFSLEFCCHVKTVKLMLSRSDNRHMYVSCYVNAVIRVSMFCYVITGQCSKCRPMEQSNNAFASQIPKNGMRSCVSLNCWIWQTV